MATSRICSIPDCGKRHLARGWCAAHYKRWKLFGNPLAGGPTPRKNTGSCSVEGCRKPDMARGLCRAHYLRWHKHGDPLLGRETMDGEPLRYLEETVLVFTGEGCLSWPYARHPSGYANVYVDGRMQHASRVVCERIYGPAPSPIHEAAHSCGKGHEGCVHPAHLRWATPTENQADKLGHGTLLRGEQLAAAKLTETDVLEIRRRLASSSQYEIARAFGVSQSTIARIRSGELWGWLSERDREQASGLG